MKKSVFLGLMILFSMSGYVVGQESETWKFSGEVRHRFEVDDKDFNSNVNPYYYNYLRSRLGMTFKPLEDVTVFFQIQDSRIMGEELSTLADGSADQLDLHQAYFKVENLFSLPADVQVGRMEVNLGPQRFVGAVNWHNIGRSFDGVILTIHTKRFVSKFFNMKEKEQLAQGDSGDKNVIGNYTDFKLIDNYVTQAFLIWQKTIPSDELSRFTTGFYVQGKRGSFDHTLEGAYQTGKITPPYLNVTQDAAAYFIAFNGGYTFMSLGAKPWISLGVAYISGDDDFGDGTFKVFDTMYSTNHKYYGSMDYFTNLPIHTNLRGLVDSHVKFALVPITRTKAILAVHNFKSAEKYTLSDNSTATDFGNEIDLTLKHQYNSSFSIIAGLSYFTPGEIFKKTKGQDASTWFFLMSSVKF